MERRLKDEKQSDLLNREQVKQRAASLMGLVKGSGDADKLLDKIIDRAGGMVSKNEMPRVLKVLQELVGHGAKVVEVIDDDEDSLKGPQ